MRDNHSTFPIHSAAMEPSEAAPSRAQSPWAGLAQLQLALWLGFAVLYFVLDQGRHPERASLPLIARSTWWALVGAATSSLLLPLYRLLRPEQKTVLAGGMVILTGSVTASILWLTSFVCLDGLIVIEPGFVPLTSWNMAQLFSELTDYTLVMLTWHGFVIAAVLAREATRHRERALRAEMLAERAKSAELRNQLNPHFLFNSLNSAAALTAEDPEAAEKMILALSDLLRDTLNRGTKPMVSVADELALAEQYIRIEQVRYEDFLQFEIESEPEIHRLPIAHLLLQPLVENAIKHGMQSSGMPLKVRVRAQHERDQLVFRVENTGQLRPCSSSDGQHHGIRILTERLALAYGDAHQFSLEQSDSWVVAELRIPKEAQP